MLDPLSLLAVKAAAMRKEAVNPRALFGAAGMGIGGLTAALGIRDSVVRPSPPAPPPVAPPPPPPPLPAPAQRKPLVKYTPRSERQPPGQPPQARQLRQPPVDTLPEPAGRSLMDIPPAAIQPAASPPDGSPAAPPQVVQPDAPAPDAAWQVNPGRAAMGKMFGERMRMYSHALRDHMIDTFWRQPPGQARQ